MKSSAYPKARFAKFSIPQKSINFPRRPIDWVTDQSPVEIGQLQKALNSGQFEWESSDHSDPFKLNELESFSTREELDKAFDLGTTPGVDAINAHVVVEYYPIDNNKIEIASYQFQYFAHIELKQMPIIDLSNFRNNDIEKKERLRREQEERVAAREKEEKQQEQQREKEEAARVRAKQKQEEMFDTFDTLADAISSRKLNSTNIRHCVSFFLDNKPNSITTNNKGETVLGALVKKIISRIDLLAKKGQGLEENSRALDNYYSALISLLIRRPDLIYSADVKLSDWEKIFNKNNVYKERLAEYKDVIFLVGLKKEIMDHQWDVSYQSHKSYIDTTSGAPSPAKIVPAGVLAQLKVIDDAILNDNKHNTWSIARNKVVELGQQSSKITFKSMFSRKDDTKKYYNLFNQKELSSGAFTSFFTSRPSSPPLDSKGRRRHHSK